MALQAEAIYVVANEQAGVGGSVWGMARGAALSLNGRVLEHERPAVFDVALRANGVLSCTRLKEFWLEGAVWVMAVSALQQSFGNPVVERLHKRSLNICMALIAEGRLLRFE